MQKVLMPIKVRRSDGSVDTEQDYFYLASDVDDRIAELEKALREVREHVRDLECYECVVCINRSLRTTS